VQPVSNPTASFTTSLIYAVDNASNSLLRINRHSGSYEVLGPLVSVVGAYDLVVDNAGLLWTGGSVGNQYVARMKANPFNIDFEVTDGLYNNPKYFVFDSKSATLWTSNQNSNWVQEVNLVSGAAVGTATVVLSISAAAAYPHGIVAPGDGFLYVIATSASSGRVFKIDPVAATIAATSTGTDLGINCKNIAYDPLTDAFYLSNTGATSRCSKIPRTTMVAADVTFDQPFLTTNVEQLAVVGGFLYFSDFISASPTVLKYTTAGVYVTSLHLSGTGKSGHIIYDGAFLWVANPTNHSISKLNPSDPGLAPVLTVTILGSAPEGMIVV
jgi:hypothetical protein